MLTCQIVDGTSSMLSLSCLAIILAAIILPSHRSSPLCALLLFPLQQSISCSLFCQQFFITFLFQLSHQLMPPFHDNFPASHYNDSVWCDVIEEPLVVRNKQYT